MINVTKTFLPPFDEYSEVLKRAWDKHWITNNGELVQELEERLKEYLGVKHLFFTNNGTIVLQMALKALNITKEVITTPFSYVATTNAILWEGCKPIFVDIETNSYCIDYKKIEEAITQDTQAILATHVFGYPCAVTEIEKIAVKHNLKVIYDGAHCFGVRYRQKSLLSYGDISTCSFHATKIFHTVEGGCIVTDNDEIANKLLLYRQFGHIGDDYYDIGINGKNSEFHAAMGICNLKSIAQIIQKRKEHSHRYYFLLKEVGLEYPHYTGDDLQYNYSYFPVVFRTEQQTLEVIGALRSAGILPRRYFYPSLNNLPYIHDSVCPLSESISSRIICLPLFYDLEEKDQQKICTIIAETLKQ